MFIRLPLAGQTRGYDITTANKGNRISLTEIIGNWYAVDSFGSKISFVNINNYFVDIEGNRVTQGNFTPTSSRNRA
jgi:hypothetical protein